MRPWAEKKVSDLIDGLVAGVSVRSRDGDLSRPAVLKTSAVAGGRVDFRETKAIIAADVSRAKCAPVRDSIVVSRMNTPALVGAVGYVEADESGVFLPDRLWLARCRRTASTDMRWLNYALGFGDVASRVRELATGTSNSMKNIPKSRLLELSVLVPIPEEQRAISTVLADIDGAIACLERLVAKKRAIKQGMMQSMMSEVVGVQVPLSKVGVTVRGVGYNPARDLSSHSTSETVDLLRANNVQDAALDLRDVKFVNRYRVRTDQYLRNGDVLICAANGSKQLVGKAAPAESVHPFSKTFGAFMMVYRPNDRAILPAYAALQFQTKSYRNHIEMLLAGSSINNLRPSDVSELSIPLPSRDEQERISGWLGDADAEILVLKRRLEVTRDIKQGMMQELLTGRTRLPVSEEVTV